MSRSGRENVGLKSLDVEKMGPKLFDDNDVLAESWEKLRGKSFSKLDYLRCATLQMGKKAHIIFYEVGADSEVAYFTSYVSRTHKRTPLAFEAEHDYENLSFLAQRYALLPDSLQERYSVVEPAAFGFAKYKEQEFPFFTMPFIPWGELMTDVVALKDGHTITDVIPFFRYSVEYTEEMSAVGKTQVDAAKVVGHQIMAGISTEDLMRLPEAQNYFKQQDDLFRACCMIYLQSEGRFPAEHMINAGDFMTVLDWQSLRTKLITVRGGFRSFEGPDHFMEVMRNTLDVSVDHNLTICPYGNMTKERMADLFLEVQRSIS